MIDIDRQARKPVYEQLLEQFERLILTGVLRPGDQMPSVRSLSLELSVHPNTVQKPFLELERLDITTSVPGIGRVVSDNAKKILSEKYTEKLGALREAADALCAAGIPLEQLIQIVRDAYRTDKPLQRGENDDSSR